MSSLMALTRTLDWFRPTSRAISVRLKPACASFRSCRSSSVVQGERLISSPPSQLYCFCSGGRGLSAGSGGDSGAPSAAGTAPLSPAASAQSPAQILVPLTVPTSLQPISVCDFCCGFDLAAFGGGDWAKATAEKQTVIRINSALIRCLKFSAINQETN